MDSVASTLAPIVGHAMASKIANLVDWSPIGAAAQGFQGGADLRRRNLLRGMLESGEALLSWAPGGKIEADALRNFL